MSFGRCSLRVGQVARADEELQVQPLHRPGDQFPAPSHARRRSPGTGTPCRGCGICAPATAPRRSWGRFARRSRRSAAGHVGHLAEMPAAIPTAPTAIFGLAASNPQAARAARHAREVHRRGWIANGPSSPRASRQRSAGSRAGPCRSCSRRNRRRATRACPPPRDKAPRARSPVAKRHKARPREPTVCTRAARRHCSAIRRFDTGHCDRPVPSQGPARRRRPIRPKARADEANAANTAKAKINVRRARITCPDSCGRLCSPRWS